MTTVRRSIPSKPTPLTTEQRIAKAQREVDRAALAAASAGADADQALLDAAVADGKAVAAQGVATDALGAAADVALEVDQVLDGTAVHTGLNVGGVNVKPFLDRTDGAVVDDPVAVPGPVIESQVRGAMSGSGSLTYNSGTGVFGLSLVSGDVTGALGYTPTSVTGLTGVQSVAALKTGLGVGSASGIASLDGAGKVPTSQLPALALTDVYVVASQAAQLALTAEEGDVAVRTDLTKSYIHNGGTAGTMADWQEMLTPTDAVLSVNGMTGAVTVTNISGNAGTATALSAGADRTKLDGIAAGATANASDATLKARTNHTGTQTANTISDFSTAADARVAAAVGVTIASYATGAFVPVLKFDGATTGITYGLQTGRWTQVGRLVTCEVAIVLSSVGSATGAATITGLPASSALVMPASLLLVGMSGLDSPLAYSVGTALVLVNQNATGLASLTHANFTNGTEIYLNITYSV